MKTNSYEIEKNVEKIKRGDSTGFITLNIYNDVIRYLKKDEYSTYYTYPVCDKVIIYSNKEPRVKLFRIDSYDKLSHQAIMGSLFGLNISSEVFGDIVLYEDKFYVYLMDYISDLVVNELCMIGNNYVKLVEVDIYYLSEYKRSYERLELIVSSLRIDTVISRMVNVNRDKAKDMIKNKLVTLNYDILSKYDYILKDGEIFSIRKLGKYKYVGIIKRTKKNNYIIEIDKYI